MRPIGVSLNIAGEEVQVRHGVTGIAVESNVQVNVCVVGRGTYLHFDTIALI